MTLVVALLMSITPVQAPECTVSPVLTEVLVEVQEHFGAKVRLHSACRTPEHNAKVGGAKHSKHLTGEAADISIEGVSPKDIADYIDKNWPDTFGLGRYNSHTHIDIRIDKARW